MLKSNNTKLTAVLVVAVFAILMTLGPTTSNFQNAFAHYGVDINQCKDDEDYYEDNEEACDKNLRAHYDDDYDGDFGSKTIDGMIMTMTIMTIMTITAMETVLHKA